MRSLAKPWKMWEGRVKRQSSLETCTSEHQERNPRARFPKAIRTSSLHTVEKTRRVTTALANLAAEDRGCSPTCSNPAFNIFPQLHPLTADNRALKKFDHIRTQNGRSETKTKEETYLHHMQNPTQPKHKMMHGSVMSKSCMVYSECERCFISTKNSHHKNKANPNNVKVIVIIKNWK